MKKFLFYLVFIAMSAYFLLPYIGEKLYHSQSLSLIGWNKKALFVGKDVFTYVESEKNGPTVVLIHGFQANKLHWSSYAEKLKSNYHLIAIDLPGHGDSSISDEQKFDIVSLSKIVHGFVEKKGLHSFHLVGSSLGGGVAATYAGNHPEKILSLVVLNPYAVVSPETSDVYNQQQEGENPFFPKNLEQFDQLFKYFIGKTVSLHPVFKRQLLHTMRMRYPFYSRAVDEMISGPLLEPVLPKIEAPTLVLIGENDQVLHSSSSTVFEEYLPNAKVKIIPSGTHTFVGKAFYQVVDEMKTFLDHQERKA